MANASVTDRKLLFVDDDPAVLEALCPYFRTRGNTVLTATDRKGALALLAEETFDAAVLDLVLPDGNGMQLFFEATRLPPVIILSTLDGEAAMLEGFSAGAVDYVVKPCSPALLEARIALRLLPRREALLLGGGLTLNVAERTVFYREKPLALTGSEFNILCFLMKHPGIFYDAEQIYTNVWEAPSMQTTTVRYHISNLRRKIKEFTQKNLIMTKFGEGYAFASAVEEREED